jgi:hypothetical protein
MLGLMEPIGPWLEDGYPLPERGGIYQVRCKRWREGKDQWDLQDPDVAMQWVIKPEPLGVAGELFIPPNFALEPDDWRDQSHLQIQCLSRPAADRDLSNILQSVRHHQRQAHHAGGCHRARVRLVWHGQRSAVPRVS